MTSLQKFLQKIKDRISPHLPKSIRRIRIFNRKTSGYAYTNTRVRVMKTKLLQKSDFEKMLKMSFPEIARYLQETEYNAEISQLAPFYSDANLIEYSLNKNIENTFNKISRFSISASQEQVLLYLKRFDVYNVKTFLRSRFGEINESNESVLAQLVCAGSLPRVFFENALKKSSDFASAIEQLKGTEYYKSAQKHKDNLSRIEDELDRQYYASVLVLAEPELQDFIADEIKVKNTQNRLRAKKADIKLEKLDSESLKKLVLPKEEDVLETRVFLKKFLVTRANKMVSEFKRNVRPVLGYFIAKENEANNIRFIVRAKVSNIPTEVIEQHLVM